MPRWERTPSSTLATSIGGVAAHTDGATASVVALLFTAAAILLTWAVARAIRWPRTRSYLVQLARYDRFDRDKQHEDPEGEELMR